MIRSIGMSSHFVNLAMLSASGLPVPFSIRERVDAETLVWSATSRKLRASSSRRRRIARPNSSVLISDFAVRGIGLTPLKRTRTISQAGFRRKILFYGRNGRREGGNLQGSIRLESALV